MGFSARSVIFDVIGRDNASKAFLSSAKAAEVAATRVDRAMARTNMVAARTQAFGQKMSKAITLPVVAAAAVSVKAAIDYQKANTLLQTAAGESDAKMRVISKGIKKVSVETGTSLHDLQEGMYTVAKAGAKKWSAIDQLKVLRAASQGAKAENVDMATATNALTSVMMSYHVPASKAVAVQNELIVGSGRAKTTMQDYASSLSTVIPIASAAHIKFAEVAGAIATMTQHGTSAHEATQELAHTIKILQTPNGVAIKAMSQLGLEADDLSKHLGSDKRGLAGTIDFLTKKIAAKMGPDGLVAVSAFKKSKTATADLRVELDHMPKSLANISAQFASGKMSYRNYNNAVKDLGGTQFRMGKDFMATVQQAQGFNDALRAGQPAARTFASYLNRTMGTATGLNTALQLGGENMAYFRRTSADVAAVGEHAGKNVHGWAKTQATLAVQLDRTKARLHVLAVDVGTTLIPVVMKTVSWVQQAWTKFDGLSSGTKKFIGVGLLIGAALGPALAILGRLTRGFVLLFGFGVKAVQFAKGLMLVNVSLATMESRAWAAGFTMRTMMTQGITAARGMGAAFAGAGIGLSIGLMTRNSSTATKAMGALGAAALGAASGFAMTGSPLGAAIGGAVGGLSSLATSFLGAGDSARDAIKPTDAYTDALRRSKGAIDGTVRSLVASDLQKKGAFDAGRTLGLDPKVLTDAAAGNKAALGRVRAAQEAYSLASLKGGKQAEAYIRANRKLTSVLGDAKKTLEVNRRAADNLNRANSVAGKNDTARAHALKRVTTLQDAASSSLNKLSVQIGIHGGQLRGESRDAQSNRGFLRQQATAYNAIARAQLNSGTSLGTVKRNLQTSNQALRQQAVQAGFSADRVDALLAKYKATPKSIVTNLVANIDHATASAGQLQGIIDAVRQNKVPGLRADSTQGRAVIVALQRRIDALTQKKPPSLKADPSSGMFSVGQMQQLIDNIRQGRAPSINANTAQGRAVISELQRMIDNLRDKTVTVRVNNIATGRITGKVGHGAEAKARGDIIRGPGTGTSDTAGVFALSNGEAVIPERAVRRNRGLIMDLIREGRGLAGGGIVHRGKDWIYNGTRYASQRAALNAQGRGRKADQSSLRSGVASAISGIGQARQSPFSVGDVGVARVQSTIAAALAKLQAAIAKGLSRKAASSLRAQIKGLAAAANRQLGALRAKIRGSDLRAIKRALKGTADDTRQAFSQLIADVRAAGGSARTLARLRTAGSQLAAGQNNVAKQRARLASMGEFRSGIADTLRGQYDSTQSGSINDFVTGLTGATDNNNKYKAQVDNLRKRAAAMNGGKGDKGVLDYINRLVAEGNTTTLATLAGSSKGEFVQASKAIGLYNASVAGGADAATTAKFGESFEHQRQDVRDAVTSVHDLGAALVKFAAAIGHQDIALVVDGEHMARRVVRSHAFDKALAELEREIRKGH